MREDITIPDMRGVPRRSHRTWDTCSNGLSYAMRSEPVAAREVRGGDWVIGLAANPRRNSSDAWRVGQVLIRETREGKTQIRIGFYGEWVAWEGDPDTSIPVYRR
ncbi:hypothetical protein [Streptomyces catenulae]|uniref:Uncharacterized protein n=1 Tax=Streptomyces catenulae TaxID=66875 RepID=A0ABV2YTC3_9ACTN|nr:hypothetical protein [Streptomyces catenulae]